MKRLLFALLLTMPIFISAQTNEKYLTNAVPEVNGKVIFSREVNVPSRSKEQIYDTMLSWARKRFDKEGSRVVYSEKEKGDIATVGEDYLVFSSSALSLDRALMNYRMAIECKDNKCKLSVLGIRYEYNVSYQREPERYIAEEWITDKFALNKDKTKLNRINGKFRKGTVDFTEKLLDEAVAALGETTLAPSASPAPSPTPVETGKAAIAAVAGTSQTPRPTVSAPASFDGFKQVTPDKIPGNIIKMLSEDWMLITAGTDAGFNMMTASWGGLGYLLEKPVAFCFINPARHTYPLMEKNDTYTLTFYTEAYREVLNYCGTVSGKDKDKVKESGLTPISTPAGSKAFSEAWMIIECRKLISQPLSTESISNEKVREEWLGKQMNKMYIGEIINVWIK